MGCRGRGALPLHQQYRNQASSDFAYFSAATTLHILCEWLRMKFSAGFLQWEPSEAFRGYEFNRQTRDVLNQNLEPQDALCFPNECSDEVWNKGSKEGSPIRVSPKQSQPLQDVDRQGG
jgi:hypothetical protein